MWMYSFFNRQKYIAGIFLTIGGAVIPPLQPSKIALNWLLYICDNMTLFLIK